MPEKRRAVNVVAPVPICELEREGERESNNSEVSLQRFFAVKVAYCSPFKHH
jgi:hypothetical protein